MGNNSDITLRIQADIAQAQAELRRMSGTMGTLGTAAERTSARLASFGTALKGLAVAAGVGTALRAIFSATIESENALAQLDARLKSTGGAAGLSREQLIAMATSLQNVSTFSDEAVLGAENIILRFGRIGKEIFPQVVKAALDVSVATGKSLPEAAELLGRAFNNPVRGIRAMEQAGAHFTVAQKEQINVMDESGRVTDIQRMFLERLAVASGGSAEALRGTLGGALAALKVAFDNLLEADTGPSGLTKDINELIATLNDPGTKQGMQGFVNLLLSMAGGVAKAAAAVGGWSSVLKSTVINPALGIDPAIGDFQQLNTEIEETKKRIADLQASQKVPLFGLTVSDSEIQKAQDRLAHLNDLMKQSLADSAKAAGGGKPAAGEAGAAGADGGAPPPEINAAYDKLLAKLKDQAAHMSLIGEAAKVRYAIEHNELGKLEPEQQALLLRYAQSIDAQEAALSVDKKAASAADKHNAIVQQVISSLEEQARVIGLVKEERIAAAAIDATDKRLAEQGIRLTEQERDAIHSRSLAAQEAARVQAEFEQIVDAATGPAQQYADHLRAVTLALDQGLISQQRYNAELRIARENYAAQASPLEKVNSDIDQQIRLLSLSADQRQIENQFLALQNDLLQKGIDLRTDEAAAAQLRGRLVEQKNAEAAAQSRDQTQSIAKSLPGADPARDKQQVFAGELARLWSDTQGRLLALQGRLYALTSAFQAGGITAAYFTNQIARLNVESAATLNELGYGNGLTVVVEALGKVLGDFKSMESSLANILGTALNDWADGLSNGIAKAVIQGENLRDALAQTAQNVATEMLSGLIKMGIQMAVNRLLASQILTDTLATQVAAASSAASSWSPAASFVSMFGGAFADGGHIRGPGTSTSDSIPALLSDNEFVTRAAVVQQPGALGFLHEFNRRGMHALEHWSRHATGGLAGFPAAAFALPADSAPSARGRKQAGGNTRILNFVDKEELMRAVMNTPAGDKFVINAVLRNRGALGLK